MDGSVGGNSSSPSAALKGNHHARSSSSNNNSHHHESSGRHNKSSNGATSSSNAMYGVPLVAVLISGIALTGCVFLYCNSLQLQAEIESLKRIVVGQHSAKSTAVDDVASATDDVALPVGTPVNLTSSPGLLRRFADMTSQLNRAVDLLNSWANFSSCLRGSDVIIGRFCYRYISFEVEFWRAEKFCARRKGHLAFIDEMATWNATVEFMTSRGIKSIWTGIYKKSQTKWRFTNNRPANFTYWDEANLFDDGDNCAFIRANKYLSRYRMFDGRCRGFYRPFMCKFLMTTSVSSSSSTKNDVALRRKDTT